MNITGKQKAEELEPEFLESSVQQICMQGVPQLSPENEILASFNLPMNLTRHPVFILKESKALKWYTLSKRMKYLYYKIPKA